VSEKRDYASVNGLELYYELHGHGPPLILLHGAPGTIENCFAKLLPVLAADHQVVAIELQAHGHTADVDGSAADALEGSIWQQSYLDVAPRPEDWRRLVAKVEALDRTFEGWSRAQIQAVTSPTLLIIGDSDIVRPEHTMEMFRLFGGGVVGDIVGLPASQLAVLPGTSHVGLQTADRP
jgi:pimeloyl-ACP methyl ester carboxylesterase